MEWLLLLILLVSMAIFAITIINRRPKQRFLAGQELVNKLPTSIEDGFGYTWKKEERAHTVEWVCYNDKGVEVGAIALKSDGSEEGRRRSVMLNAFCGDGVAMERLMEQVRISYEFAISSKET